jgi:tripeptidyl-peptidase-1
MALAPEAHSTFWYVAWTPYTNPFLKYVRDLAGREDIADVHSISYLNDEIEVHPEAQQLFNDEVCKLGLRGVTVIVSSGDEGAPGIAGCHYTEKKFCKLSPAFPANCPFVTTVGATMGPERGPEGEEVAAQPDPSNSWAPWDISSGGGFSGIFPRPAWQYRAVKKYLNSYNDPENSGDTATWGRGYPDVSFLGYHYDVFLLDQSIAVSGTSASAPTFASLIALINSLRIERGLPKLGYLNPLLYSKILSHSYNDITKGDNRCCMGQVDSGTCCPHGWFASPGWDPITGLGSPDIGKWLEVLLTDFTKTEHENPDLPIP